MSEANNKVLMPKASGSYIHLTKGQMILFFAFIKRGANAKSF